ncbi:MAG: cytochrome b/b6 domain-containing protein [Proteobacteria bacterium]|nr:cytochrome b/b6 domain-containing protein [Pseudomonadota bacterium]
MPLLNSPTQYGAVTKTFHWGTALIVIFLLALGLFMGDLPNGTLKLQAFNLHKSLGITVLVLTLCRFCWHLISRFPGPVETLKPWENLLSKILIKSLYVLLIAQPLIGWIFSSAAGRSVHVFGLAVLPDLVSPDKSLAKSFRELHGDIGTIIMIIVGLHIVVALKHHFLDKDQVLRRMLPLVLLLLLSFPAAAADNKWYYMHDDSHLTIAGKQMGNDFRGEFLRFAPDITFDPDDLAASKVTVSIDTASLDTYSADRNDTAKGKAWFNVAEFPSAQFETTAFRKTGDVTYEATANLTILDVTLPITLPFKLAISKGSSDKDSVATMDGSIVLDRSKFKLGSGSWSDPGVIANEVTVTVHVVARR